MPEAAPMRNHQPFPNWNAPTAAGADDHGDGGEAEQFGRAFEGVLRSLS